MKQIFLTILMLLSLNSYAASNLNIINPLIPEAPPGANVMAGYMQINNTSNEQIDITGINSPSFKSVEMHLSKEVDGFAKMLPQKKLSIPANGNLTLQPGGYHLMLIQPVKRLKQGEKVKLNFTLSNKEHLVLEVAIQKTRSRAMKCAAGKCGGM